METTEIVACPKCGQAQAKDAIYCRYCGSLITIHRPIVGADGGPLDSTPAKSVPGGRKPWYLQPWFLILAFLFLTPVWAVLIVLDRSQQKWIRIAVGIIGAAYLVYAVPRIYDAFISEFYGPGTITFGTDYRAESGGFTIVGQKSYFAPSEKLAWVAELKDAVGSTHLEIVLSEMKDRSGTETFVSRTPLGIARTDSVMIAVREPAGYSLPSGHYVMRIYREDTALAVGEFSISTSLLQ